MTNSVDTSTASALVEPLDDGVDATVDELPALAFISSFPFLRGSNWREWDCSLQNVLRPIDGVLDILLGKVVKGQAGYSEKIDDNLLAIIDRNVESHFDFVLLNLQDGEKGAAAYRHLMHICSTVYASSNRKNATEEIVKLHQNQDETFGDYAIRAMNLQKQAYDTGVFKVDGKASEFIDAFYQGIETEEKHHPKARDLIQKCGGDLVKLVGHLQDVHL